MTTLTENRRGFFTRLGRMILLFSILPDLVVAAELSSFATGATDLSGVTGATTSSLGPPDYLFINDQGLGFGGTSAEVFGVGESVELIFPVPLRNIVNQHDIVFSVYVGGLGATDNATVQVEVRADSGSFVIVDSFDTDEARDRDQDRQENDFDGVKHFFVDFASEDHVVAIRLTNLAGTAEGLRLDAVEGLHPLVDSLHAFEIRFDRWRPDSYAFFFVRIKNISDVGGVAIREFKMTRSPTPFSTLENTIHNLIGLTGDLICVENCITNSGPLIPFSRHAWSIDGLVEAPVGVGLDPGQQVAHPRFNGFDTDNTDYLSGLVFEVLFTDGFVHQFTYDDDVMKVVGSLYQKYLYFREDPVESWNRPTDYYQFAEEPAVVVPVPTLSPMSYGFLAMTALVFGDFMVRRRNRENT